MPSTATTARSSSYLLLIMAAGLASLAGRGGDAQAATSSCPAATPVVEHLQSVAAVSASDVWAAGSCTQAGALRPLIEHWNGTAWTQVPAPAPDSGAGLNGIAAAGGTAWAVGDYSNGTQSRPLAERWTGTAWVRAAIGKPGQPGVLNGVAARSATDAWAVGDYLAGRVERTVIEHWNGTRWHRVPSPDPGGSASNTYLTGVTATGPRNAWAVGSYENSATGREVPVIERWNGTRWSLVPARAPQCASGIVLNGVSAASAASAWAVGYCPGPSDLNAVLHWNGHAWKPVHAPSPGVNDGGLEAVAAVSRSDAWAVGGYLTAGDTFLTLILHWNGHAWAQAHSPSPNSDCNLEGVAALSAADAWAVGQTVGTGGAGLTLTEHWGGTSWLRVKSP